METFKEFMNWFDTGMLLAAIIISALLYKKKKESDR